MNLYRVFRSSYFWMFMEVTESTAVKSFYDMRDISASKIVFLQSRYVSRKL